MSQTNQKGFTLVEIAIVLVIIGLLLGGVMKGQELIANAKIKSTQSAIQQYTAAIYSYQDKTGKLPGDDNTAGIVNPGNGNGQIAAGAEAYHVFTHLQAQNLISGTYTGTSYPINKFGGFIEIASNLGGFGTTAVSVCYTGLDKATAIELDTKMDDGVSNTGSVVGTGTAPGNNLIATYAATNNSVCFKM